jgi:hypothetical protein
MQVRKLDWVVWMTSFLSTMFLGVEISLAISFGLVLPCWPSTTIAILCSMCLV